MEVNPKGEVVHVTPLKTNQTGYHLQVRNIHQLANGNILVPHEGEGAVREVDPDGNVVWKWEDHSLIKSLTKMRTGPVFCEMLAGRSRQHSGCYRATHRE